MWFNNKLNKYQRNYDYLTGILKSSNIDTKEKVDAQLKQVTIRATILSLVTITITVVLHIVANKYAPLWYMLAAFVLVWGWASAISASKIMKQYAAEELN